jgi:hypothetical protein
VCHAGVWPSALPAFPPSAFACFSSRGTRLMSLLLRSDHPVMGNRIFGSSAHGVIAQPSPRGEGGERSEEGAPSAGGEGACCSPRTTQFSSSLESNPPISDTGKCVTAGGGSVRIWSIVHRGRRFQDQKNGLFVPAIISNLFINIMAYQHASYVFSVRYWPGGDLRRFLAIPGP